jgi:hypothetical protein
MSSNTVADEVFKTHLEKIGVKAVRDQKKNIEKIVRWLDVEPQ